MVAGASSCQAADWRHPRLYGVPPPVTHPHRPESHQESHYCAMCKYIGPCIVLVDRSTIGAIHSWSQILLREVSAICIIRHMSDIARYMRRIFWIGILSASAWPSLISTISTPPCHTSLESYWSRPPFGTELSRFEVSYKPSEFCWHLRTDS